MRCQALGRIFLEGKEKKKKNMGLEGSARKKE